VSECNAEAAQRGLQGSRGDGGGVGGRTPWRELSHDEQSSLIHESEDDEREAAEGLTQVYSAPLVTRKSLRYFFRFLSFFAFFTDPTLLAGAFTSIGALGSPR
jgi:hypothetical protein